MTSSGGINFTDAVLPWLIFSAIALSLLPWIDRNNKFVRPIALAICIAVSWRYMSWRITETVPPTSNVVDFVLGVIFVCVELLAMIGSTISSIVLMRTRNRSAQADENVAWMQRTHKTPLVDVLICTYDESEVILERTIFGAQSLKYENCRVWVCDDGRRDWLKERCRRQGVNYLTRADGRHAKAGNINAALAHLATLDTRPEFVAIVDADFVVNPWFLTRTVAMMREADVGIVQTPQHFFNPDPIQSNLNISRVWPDEQRFFFDEVMPAKDAWGVAICCGTSAIMRYSALREVGGFPTSSVTEDYHLTLRLKQAGYRTIYLNEVLSLGLAPEGLAEYCTQRSRWSMGFAQIFRSTDGPLNLTNSLPLAYRISLIEGLLYWTATYAFRLMGIVAPTLYLLFDIQVVHANVIDAVDHLVPYFLLPGIIFAWLTAGRVLPIMADLYQCLCAIEIVKATTLGLARPVGRKFQVTAKGGDRSRTYIQWPMLRVFAIALAIVAIGIANTFLIEPSRALPDSAAVPLVWSWYNMLILTLACLVCIEQPQRSERFPTTEIVLVNGKPHQAVNISASGVLLLGLPPGCLGTWCDLNVGQMSLRGRVARKTEDGFAIAFDATLQNRAYMTAHIFSGRYNSAVHAIRSSKLVGGIARRLFY